MSLGPDESNDFTLSRVEIQYIPKLCTKLELCYLQLCLGVGQFYPQSLGTFQCYAILYYFEIQRKMIDIRTREKNSKKIVRANEANNLLADSWLLASMEHQQS